MRKIVQIAVLSGIITCFDVLGANAQLALPPQNVDPGAINSINSKGFSDLTRIKSIEKEEEKINTQKPEISVQADVGDIETVKITKVSFIGNTVFSSSDLERFTNELIGKDSTAEEIIDAVQTITDLYQRKGYLTSFAYIPNKKIDYLKKGILEINIFEGKVGEINITGTRWTRDSFIKNNIFKANKIDKSRIFNVNNLNSSIKELNKNDYLRGQISIQKGDEPEASDIVLNLKERLPFKLGASWDNLGRELIGVQRANISLTDTNLTGFGDTLSGNVSFASGTFGVGSSYSLPLGPYGTKFNFGYSYSKVNIGGAYKDLEIVGNSHLYSPGIIQPIYKSDRLKVTSDLSFDFGESRTNLLKTIKLQEYSTRALRLGLSVTREDDSGRWLSRNAVSVGLPLFGATKESGYGLGSSKFVKLNTDLIRVQRLPFKSMGIFRVTGQFTPDALLALEQMQLGGSYTVRGFDEGLLLGDIGYNASIEIRRPVPFLPNLSIPYWKNKHFNLNLKDRIHIAAFYDQGLAKPIHQEMKCKFLQGIGAGLRINLSKFITANIDFGVPIGGKIIPDQKSTRFHFGLSSNLL